MPQPAERALAAALAAPWAITEEGLDLVLSIAERVNEDPMAVAAKLGRPLDNTHRVSVRDGVAIIPVAGPLHRYANLFSAVSGATSYAVLAQDLTAALDEPAVNAVLLEVDSPGGMVNGVHELAGMIHAARGRKPITAWIGGAGASAAYWLASAADRMVASETALVGSIGVRMAVMDSSVADERRGVKRYEFVSSQSPAKVDDLATEEGRARMQRVVDAQAKVFIAAVAKHRGVDAATVLDRYGKGGVEVGADALAAGLVDEVSSFEATLAALAKRGSDAAAQRNPFNPFRGAGAALPGGALMDPVNQPAAGNPPAPPAPPTSPTAASIAAQHPEIAAALRAEGAQAERERITQIEALAMPGHEQLLAKAKADGAMTPAAFAMALVAAEKQRKVQGLANFQGDSTAQPMPPASTDPTANGLPPQAPEGAPQPTVQQGWTAAMGRAGIAVKS